MKRFNLILLAAALMASASCSGKVNTPDDHGSGDDNPPAQTISLRMMQFNILQATSETAGHEWAAVRRKPCVAMIRDIDPDIICVEEARKSQCNDLQADLAQYGQVKHPKDNIETNGGQRNLVMYKTSKYSVLEWGKFWFSVDGTATGDRWGDKEKTTQKMTLWVKFKEKESGRNFYVFCSHFFAEVPDDSYRTKCVNMALDKIKEIVPEHMPVFLCGDFNIDYGTKSSLLAPLNKYMKNAAVAARNTSGASTTTYNKFGASTKTLDYIYIRNITASKYKVVNSDSYGTTYVSDHYPIFADCEL